jgi:hypothetical protein
LRHTFASVAGDLGFSELTIRALLGHGSQSVTQDYIHIDEALKLAIARTCAEVASLLDKGGGEGHRPCEDDRLILGSDILLTEHSLKAI